MKYLFCKLHFSQQSALLRFLGEANPFWGKATNECWKLVCNNEGKFLLN